MDKIYCKCGKKIIESTYFCPYCGRKLKCSKNNWSKKNITILVSIILAIFIGIYFFITHNPNNLKETYILTSSANDFICIGNPHFLSDFNDYSDFSDSIFLYEYDANGKLLAANTQNSEYPTEFEYKDNLMSQITTYDTKGNNSHTEGILKFKYDENGNLAKTYWYGEPDLELGRWWEYKYNKDGRLINSYTFNSSDDNISTVEYKYNKSGKLSKSIRLDNNGNTVSTIKYTYDENGNLKKKSIIDEYSDVSEYNFNYETLSSYLKNKPNLKQ